MAVNENKPSMKGMKRESGHPSTVAGIEEHTHAGERGHQGGVVFKIPGGLPDHSCVMKTPEVK